MDGWIGVCMCSMLLRHAMEVGRRTMESLTKILGLVPALLLSEDFHDDIKDILTTIKMVGTCCVCAIHHGHTQRDRENSPIHLSLSVCAGVEALQQDPR